MTGRCAGCGLSNRSSAKVVKHTRYCPDYNRLYREDPSRALAPEAEFRRWAEEQRADDRADHKEAVIEEADRRRAEQKDRWATPPDILEGD